MNTPVLPIVIFDRQHSLFFPSQCHALNYLMNCEGDSVFIFDGKGQPLFHDKNDFSEELILSNQSPICKAMLLVRFEEFLKTLDFIGSRKLDEISISQLISLVYRHLFN